MSKYSFMETIIASERYLHYHLDRSSIREHRDIIIKNADKLRIISYTHQSPDGTESICYAVHGYIPLEKVFRRRHINLEELILLLYGIVHTVSNAQKCGLLEDSFILDPSHVYLSHDSIQPYLMYLPTMADMSLRDEFLALMNFLDVVADPAIPNAKKLVSVIRDIALEDFDLDLIINVVVQAANKKEVIAPPKRPKAKTSKSTAAPKQASKQVVSQSAATPAAYVSTPVPRVQPAPRPTRQAASAPKKAASAPASSKQKQGFFARFFGSTVQEKQPDGFLQTIDDRTMIDFTAWDDDEGRPILYVMDGNSRTTQISITKDAFVIGRDRSKVDHCFDGPTDKGISREHAAIIFDGSSYFIVDKGSSGGTFVNDVRLAPNGSAGLEDGDIISLYTKKLLFEMED